MVDTYLNDQNISNNIIIKKKDETNKYKRIIISSEKSMSYSSSVDDKNETIDNQINDSTSSFDYSDTLRVSEIPKKETAENFFEKSKNFLGLLSKAVAENFDFFNLPRKTNINDIIVDKNKKFQNISYKRSTSGGNLRERIKKKRFVSSSENKNKIINHFKASKINNKDNSQNKRITNVIKLNNNKGNKIKSKNIKENKDKKIIGKVVKRNKNNIICRNINININSKNSKSLTNLSFSKNINCKETNDINNINKNKLNKKANEQETQKSKIIQKPTGNNNQMSIINKIKTTESFQENFKKLNNHIPNEQYSRLTYIETPNIKNIDITPRLTNPLHVNKNNKNNQINLDNKINHILSKSPKNVLVKKIFPLQDNLFKQINENINSMNRQAVSPNPNKFGRQSVEVKRNIINNKINNNNQLMNSMNNLCSVKRLNDDFNPTLNNITNKNNIQIFNYMKNQLSRNQLVNTLPKLDKSFAPITSQQRLTVSSLPSLNNNLSQDDNSLYSPRLTNVNIPPNNKNQINLNISLNPIINNYHNYILPENQISKTKTDFNVTYNSFEPNGVLKNYGILTLPGKDTSGNQKTNQDSFTFITNINNIKDFNIFGVLDGHGVEGHFVSKFASKYIPHLIMNNPEIKNLRETELIYNTLKKNNFQIISKAYLDCDIALQQVNFDSKESGCTCNLIINIGTHIICANTGDSRAIIVFEESKDWLINYKCIPLSVDFKPEMPEEMNRIILSGGEVRQIKNELGEGVGPFRVWKRGEGFPGLAMSRSIGDLNGKKIGIIPNPGVIEYNLGEKSRYIVVCSDGVWEFLNNENVKDIGKKYYVENNPSGYCHDLVNTSLSLWEKNDIVVDDITAVVAFF